MFLLFLQLLTSKKEFKSRSFHEVLTKMNTTLLLVITLLIIFHSSSSSSFSKVEAVRIQTFKNIHCEGKPKNIFWVSEGNTSCSEVSTGPVYFKTICNKSTNDVRAYVYWSYRCTPDSIMTSYDSSTLAAGTDSMMMPKSSPSICFQTSESASININCDLKGSAGKVMIGVMMMMMLIAVVMLLLHV